MTRLRANIKVVDQTRLPIVALAVRHWQDPKVNGGVAGILEYRAASLVDKPSLDDEKKWRRGEVKGDGLVLIDQEIEFENSGHDVYWTVAWQNAHDPAVYYLVKQPSLWHELEQRFINTVSTALGYGLDVCTESPAGTIGAEAAKEYVNSVFDQNKGNAKIENKINTDHLWLTITLECNRTVARIESTASHTTGCYVKFYLKDSTDGGQRCTTYFPPHN